MSTHDAHVEPWTFPLCPAPPSWALDWPAIEERFAWMRALGGCPQDPTYHAEGDVLAHTRLVAEALVASGAWRALPAPERSILFVAERSLLITPSGPILAKTGRTWRVLRPRRSAPRRRTGVGPPPSHCCFYFSRFRCRVLF